MRWNFVTRVYISIDQGVLLDLAGHRYGESNKPSATTGLQLLRSVVDFSMHDPGLKIYRYEFIPGRWQPYVRITGKPIV